MRASSMCWATLGHGIRRAPAAARRNGLRAFFVASLCLAAGCSDSQDSKGSAIAGSTGKSTVLAGGLDFPTGVAVRGQTAWVTEGQLDRYVGGNATPPTPFDAVSVPLSGGGKSASSISLPGTDFFPEGITATEDGTLYIGSLKTGVIERVAPGSTSATSFVDVGVMQRGTLGMRVDAKRGLLWACDSDPGENMPGADVVGLDLAAGTETVRHAMTATSFCNDIVIDDRGNLFATDTFQGAIYEIAANDVLTPNSASVWLKDPRFDPKIDPDMMVGFGINGIALLGQRLFVSNTAGGDLIRIDPTSSDPASTISVVAVTEGGTPLTLSGPDGIEAISDTELLVVENGFRAPNRQALLKITLGTE